MAENSVSSKVSSFGFSGRIFWRSLLACRTSNAGSGTLASGSLGLINFNNDSSTIAAADLKTSYAFSFTKTAILIAFCRPG